VKIGIIGLGTIGSNLAMNLIADCKEHDYYLLDRDKVEPRNLQAHTQAYLKEQIDMPKANALRINIYNFLAVEAGASKWDVGSSTKRYKHALPGEPFDLVIDCLDNYEGRKVLSDYSKKFKTECLHIGFSPQFTFEICWDKSYEVPPDIKGLDICSLEGASSFVKFVASLASSVIQDFLRNGKKRNLIGNRFSIRELQNEDKQME